MKYFDKHPIINYTLNGNNYNFIDIFRRNILNIDERFLETYIFESNDTLESIATKQYDDASLSWAISLANNYYSKDTIPSLDTTIPITNNKVYSILELPNIKFGDIVFNINNIGDPTFDFLYIKSWDPRFRSFVVGEKLPTGNSFNKSDTIIIARLKEGGVDLVTTPQGVSLQKITNTETFPIRFSLSSSTISPYLNVSGSGTTYISEGSTGITFSKTLLYSYITSGISHSQYKIDTEQTNFIVNKNDLSIKIPTTETINTIESGIADSMKITNKSRLFNINIQ